MNIVTGAMIAMLAVSGADAQDSAPAAQVQAQAQIQKCNAEIKQLQPQLRAATQEQQKELQAAANRYAAGQSAGRSARRA